MTLERELRKVEYEFNSKYLYYESRLMEAWSAIIQSESTGYSWL